MAGKNRDVAEAAGLGVTEVFRVTDNVRRDDGDVEVLTEGLNDRKAGDAGEEDKDDEGDKENEEADGDEEVDKNEPGDEIDDTLRLRLGVDAM